MNAGSFFFVVLAVGFIGFEIFAATRNSYRTEPAYVFEVYAKSAHAVAQCGALKPVSTEKFDANYRYVRERAAAAMSAEGDVAPNRDAKTVIGDRERQVERNVDALIQEYGCDNTEVWKLRKHYESLARLNTPGSRAAEIRKRLGN